MSTESIDAPEAGAPSAERVTYAAAEALERHLGDPADGTNLFSFERCVALDEREEYPQAIADALDEWGFHLFYVPRELGGKIATYDEVLAMFRAIARRDLTVAIGHAKTYLGAVAVWVAGSEPQRRAVAEAIQGHEAVALALTERAHGTDLLASDVRAEKVDGGYRLTGEKWLINNATRSTTLTVFARTDPRGGPRGFSLFLVRKPRLDPSTFTHLPKIKTHGIRGADISGITFDECMVGEDDVIGSVGGGLEITMKLLQLTRTICAALSLGAADTALRLTLDFTLTRTLYRESVFAIPNVRSTLVDALLDLLVCDATSIATTRAIHVAPEEMSVRSAILKYFVPTTSEEIVRRLSVVLGARHYLRQDFAHGVFQKLLRDNQLVSLFDGSSVVNLSALGFQLRQLAARRAKDGEAVMPAREERLADIFTLDRPLPPLDPKRLDLLSQGRDDTVQGLPGSLAAIASLRGSVDAAVLDAILESARGLVLELASDERALRALPPTAGATFTAPEIFELARRYSVIHAAASCVHMWRYNRTSLDDFFARGEWLALCLRRALERFRPAIALEPRPFTDAIAEDLRRLARERRLFSLVPVRIA
jgi:alkylation response protein AidB-like acyl-CoA dehydrogenase